MGKRKIGIANLLIIAGAVLLLAFGIYSALNYPWRTMLARWGILELSEPPDPDPLPLSFTSLPPASGAAPETALPAVLPGDTEEPADLADANLTLLGSIKITRIQLSENIVEGSGWELCYAVGHVPGSALPGQPGNCVLAGHRNYVPMRPFRYLNMVEVGDEITLTDSENRYIYEVFDIFEVTPDDTWVLEPQEDEENMLTLLTCTPVIGLTHRLVVRAKLTDFQSIA